MRLTPSHKIEEARFRAIHHKAHADHPPCLKDEWLAEPCRTADGAPVARPLAWSRRNGPWRRSEILWVGAAPGNAGGKGSSPMGAHGTRIPFGGDIAGANLEVLFGSIGLDRNHTFITAALNQLPLAGGGEPTLAEMATPIGNYPSSLHLLRDTIVAAGPRLVVALGNVALRATFAAAALDGGGPIRLPSLSGLQRAGLQRGALAEWPTDLHVAPHTQEEWDCAWPDAPLPAILWLTHPSAQNMSPYARVETVFHTRMLDARAQLRAAVLQLFERPLPEVRPEPPADGIYALPEWRQLVGPRHAALDRLWRAKGI